MHTHPCMATQTHARTVPAYICSWMLTHSHSCMYWHVQRWRLTDTYGNTATPISHMHTLTSDMHSRMHTHTLTHTHCSHAYANTGAQTHAFPPMCARETQEHSPVYTYTATLVLLCTRSNTELCFCTQTHAKNAQTDMFTHKHPCADLFCR